MRVDVAPGNKLDADLVRAWREILDRAPDLESPYFRPEFTAAVASVRRDVEVGIIVAGGEPLAFFPFQRTRRHVARPVGGALSDHHGVIATPDVEWTVRDLLLGCRLRVFEFDHLQANQTPFAPYVETRDRSPVMLLENGYEAYALERREAGSKQIQKIATLRRKLEREVGELRFEIHDPASEAFESLLAWKSRQYRESGLIDVFCYDWTTALLRVIRDAQEPEFAGVMSSLYAGDQLVAVHFGMRSRTVLHYWFPAYDTEFARYSPGLVLLLEIANAAARLGIKMIDLGMGQSLYKERLANGAIPLVQGAVELPSVATALRRLRRGTETCVRRSPLYPIARLPGRFITRLGRRRRFN